MTGDPESAPRREHQRAFPVRLGFQGQRIWVSEGSYGDISYGYLTLHWRYHFIWHNQNTQVHEVGWTVLKFVLQPKSFAF